MYELNIATEEDILEVTKNLIIYNNQKVPFTQNPPFTQLKYAIKHNDIVIGGILAQVSCWDSLEVEALWVDEKYRGKGHAKKLLKMVEDAGIKLGCVTFQLDTFDFQAKDFYESVGYSVFGQINDSPLGHIHYYRLSKYKIEMKASF